MHSFYQYRCETLYIHLHGTHIYLQSYKILMNNLTNTQNNNQAPPPVNNTHQPISLDIIIHDELDQANKHAYYSAVNQELQKACQEQQANQSIVPQETEIYIQSFRNYYYTSQVLAHNKSNDFFQEIIRELHPVSKIKGPVKGILKTFCKIFIQELAQTCLQIMNKTKRTQLDSQVISDAYRCILQRKPRKTNVGSLFGYIM